MLEKFSIELFLFEAGYILITNFCVIYVKNGESTVCLLRLISRMSTIELVKSRMSTIEFPLVKHIIKVRDQFCAFPLILTHNTETREF